jgi:hypothetical protein
MRDKSEPIPVDKNGTDHCEGVGLGHDALKPEKTRTQNLRHVIRGKRKTQEDAMVWWDS